MDSTRSYHKHGDFQVILLVHNTNHCGALQSGCVLLIIIIQLGWGTLCRVCIYVISFNDFIDTTC